MEEVSLRGRDFSFDPETLDFRSEGGGAQHGMSFDADWNKFVCSNSDHIQSVVYDPFLRVRTQWFVGFAIALEHCAGWSSGTCVPHQSRRTMARDAHTVARGWRCLGGRLKAEERLRGISPGQRE